MIASVESRLAENLSSDLSDLLEFLRIRSISTDPIHSDACAAAAAWLSERLTTIGFDTRVVATTGKPAVLAHGPRVPGAMHVLFYGHYDVQPADPEDGWSRPPFEPAIIERSDREVIHGRGSADDKGQLMTFIRACRAHIEAGGLPVNVTMLLEGEEEIGSPSMPELISKLAPEIGADITLICDTAMLGPGRPAIGCQLRGFVGEIIRIRAASADLHSGNFGGIAHNPAIVLAKALGSITDDSGRILLTDFYDGVVEPPSAAIADWAALDDIAAGLLPAVGLSHSAGESDRSVLEQVWSRPAFDINSMASGYIGEGFKTILPSTAEAKVSFRLVGVQSPEKVREAFRKHIQNYIPSDCSVDFEPYGTVRAVQMDTDGPAFSAAQTACASVWQEPCRLIGMGGSIPVVGLFKSALAMDCVLLGFGLPDDNIHGIDEKYDLESFKLGSLCWSKMLTELANKFASGSRSEAAPERQDH